MEESQIYLYSGQSGEMVPASLFDEIAPEHVTLWRSTWVTALKMHNAGREPYDRPEDSHWSWDLKIAKSAGFLSYHSFAIICDAGLQALMICEDLRSASLQGQFGKPMVYVSFIATAPWNRPEIQRPARFRGCGRIMLLAAIEASRSTGAKGRIGLHSLPGAEDFYQNKCGMTRLGADSSHQNLIYYEMTETQADAFSAAAKNRS